MTEPFPPTQPATHQRLAVTRRQLLGAAAVTAAAGVLSPGVTSTAGAVTSTSRRPADIPAPGTLPLTGGPEFPIGLFWPPPPYQSTVSRFAEIARAGFTFLITGNYTFDHFIGARQLALAEQTGLQVLVAGDPLIQTLAQTFTIGSDPAADLVISPDEARQLYTQALSYYSPYSSFAGFSLYDEPSPDRFASLAEAMAIARKESPKLLPYVNQLPSNDQSYYQDWVDAARPSQLSFDRYPFLAGDLDDTGYFDNWAKVRAVALAAGIPAWTYIQSIGFDNHRTPTGAEMLWQINVSLAYGCKGIQYFTYWTPDPARGEDFVAGLITVDGKQTARYDEARTINKTWLAPAGGQLKPLVSESVVFANESPLPEGTVGFTPTAYLKAVSGAAVIVATFASQEPGQSDRWVLVVNGSHRHRARARLVPDATTVEAVSVFDARHRRYRRSPTRSRIDVDLDTGAATLLRFAVR